MHRSSPDRGTALAARALEREAKCRAPDAPRIDRCNEQLEVIRKPEVIMPEVGDDVATCLAYPFVVWSRLMAGVCREIVPTHPRSSSKSVNV